jgi:hypothetical protein
VLFPPFGRGSHRELLGIPAREENGAFRPPPIVYQCAKRPGYRHERSRSAGRIHTAIQPGISMIADDHNLIRRCRSAKHPRHCPDRPHAVVHTNLESHALSTGTNAVRHRQPAFPGLWRSRSAERFENWPCIVCRNRHTDDLWQRRSFRPSDAWSSRDRRPPGCQRIARNDVVIDDAATLDSAVGTPRSIGIWFPPHGSLIGGIRVHENSHGTSLLGGQRLESAVAVWRRIANEDDASTNVDALGRQPLVLCRFAGARIQHRCGDVSRC